jgi:uncharacterized protein
MRCRLLDRTDELRERETCVKISMHKVANDSFVRMLTNLSEILDKGAAFARNGNLDLQNCRLAPDMFTLAQQVQQACYYAQNAMSRLSGRPPVRMDDAGTTLSSVQDQITRTIDFIRAVPDVEFEGSEERDCSIEIPNGLVIEMDGLHFLECCSLPHFYFHVVTACDILRYVGVGIGKKDYIRVADFVHPKAA